MVSAFMPMIGDNPTAVIPAAKTSVGSKAASTPFSSELAKATDAAQPPSTQATTAELPFKASAPTKADHKAAVPDNSRPQSPVSGATDSRLQQQLVGLAPSPLPVAITMPTATSELAAPGAVDGSPSPETDTSSSAAGTSISTVDSPLHSALGPVDWRVSTSTLAFLNLPALTMTGAPLTGSLPSLDNDVDGAPSEATAQSLGKPGAGKETQAAGQNALRAATAVVPIPAADREISPAAEVHKVSKPTVDIGIDTDHAPKVAPTVNETAKAETRNSPSSELAPSEPGKSSQAAGDGKSDHASKHDSNSTASQGLGLEAKDVQRADTPSSFANVIAAQTSGNSIAKDASATAVPFNGVPLNNVAQAQDVPSSHASKPPEISTAEQQPVENSPLSVIQAARLIERAGQSELHVGFQAGEFGNVDIRTSMVHNQLSAEISVEHNGLRNLLAVELPHLQERLVTQQVTGANISLNSQPGGGSPHSGQAYRQSAPAQRSPSAHPAETEAMGGNVSIAESQTVPAQLDIHM
jgi:flagellar hook-length control protein FliK